MSYAPSFRFKTGLVLMLSLSQLLLLSFRIIFDQKFEPTSPEPDSAVAEAVVADVEAVQLVKRIVPPVVSSRRQAYLPQRDHFYSQWWYQSKRIPSLKYKDCVLFLPNCSSVMSYRA